MRHTVYMVNKWATFCTKKKKKKKKKKKTRFTAIVMYQCPVSHLYVLMDRARSAARATLYGFPLSRVSKAWKYSIDGQSKYHSCHIRVRTFTYWKKISGYLRIDRCSNNNRHLSEESYHLLEMLLATKSVLFKTKLQMMNLNHVTCSVIAIYKNVTKLFRRLYKQGRQETSYLPNVRLKNGYLSKEVDAVFYMYKYWPAWAVSTVQSGNLPLKTTLVIRPPRN